MQRILTAIAVAALGAAIAIAPAEALQGGTMATAELRRVPAVLALLGLMVVRGGPGTLPAAVGWMLAGLAAGPWVQAGHGLPGEAVSRNAALLEVLGLLLVAALAWRRGPAWLLGPLLAILVAATRLGGYGRALAPALWEDTPSEALLMGGGILVGLATGIAVFLIAGWGIAILARLAERRLPADTALAVLAVTAALGHMVAS